MNLGALLAKIFEKIPERPIKNDIRYFLAFNRFMPSLVTSISPVKGYELYYNLKEGDVVVDAGAYPGDYAVFAARKVGPKGKVIAFEPDEKNRKILARNLAKDKLNNIIIVPKGLWSKKTTLKFSDSDGLHTTIFSDIGSQKIDVVKLDDELKKLKIKKVDVIKMDIEGAEVEAIKGCKKTLQENKVKVAIASYHIVDGKRTSYIMEDYLSKLGYNVKSDFPKHLTTYAWK
ncbi:MAG: FkbM family methyltransferase [Nanoarchaeota archaeon]|nr:FkbM family methyltransferase [Nanoarchaeota archaeon]